MKKLNELQSYLTRLRGLMLTLIILCSIGSGNVWGEDYTLTTTITDGDYVIGCIKGTAGTDNSIRAINATITSGWGKYATVTPSGGKIANPSSDIVWTLTKISANSFSLKNGSVYYKITTGTGSGSVATQATSSTIYFAAVGSSTNAFELSGVSTFTVSSGNQLACNQGSGYGYRQYAQRTHETTATGISTQVRFYKKASPHTVTLMDDNSELEEASAGAGVTLPSRDGCPGYTFVGWTASWTEEQDEWTQVAPAIIPAGLYNPISDINLYPVYRKGSGAASATITTTLTAGKQYVIGAVKAAPSATLANNTAIGAIGFTGLYSSTSWGQYTTYTPNTSGEITAAIGSQYIWTLESITSGKYSFKNNNNASYPYIYLSTSTGSNQAGLNTTGQVYLENANATCKDAFLLHPSSTGTNKLLLNTNSNCGYRMYGSSQAASASMCPYIRFYEYNIDYYYISEPSCETVCADPTAATKGTFNRSTQVMPIDWTSAAGKVDVCYSTSSTTPAATPSASYTVVSDQTSSPVNLNVADKAAGNYYCWVRSVCDAENKSDWVAITGNYFTIPGHTLTINASPASSGTFTKSPNISTVVENRQVSITATPAAGYNFSSWSVSGTGAALSSTSTNPTTFTMGTANATVTGTFTAKPLVSISLSAASGEVYVGQYVTFDITYNPSDVLTKGTTLVATPSYCVTTGTTNMTLKITGGRSGVTITENVTETVSIKANADNTKTASVTITVKPLPLVHFTDVIHGESFSDVVATISANALVDSKTTPTHADFSGSGANTCEDEHVHLVGWILKDWADAHPNATSSEISGAGSTNYITAGAAINVSTFNGKTFYAVWSKVE